MFKLVRMMLSQINFIGIEILFWCIGPLVSFICIMDKRPFYPKGLVAIDKSTKKFPPSMSNKMYYSMMIRAGQYKNINLQDYIQSYQNFNCNLSKKNWNF